ncbi:hypothetical protein DEJ35_15615 [Curtobacterium sp. MCPF17_051]|nr:hypothetical protein DEJ35_15615 [Curtobacterium sp. MCPF17_051]
MGAARVRVGARGGLCRGVRGDVVVRGVRLGAGRPGGTVVNAVRRPCRSGCAARRAPQSGGLRGSCALKRFGASTYLAHGPLAGPTFEAAAAASATLAFTSLHIPEGSPAEARAAATAIVSAAASSGLSVVTDVSPNTARLPAIRRGNSCGQSGWRGCASTSASRSPDTGDRCSSADRAQRDHAARG